MCIRDSLGRAGVADHEEGADRGNFPSGEQPLQVIRNHDHEHGRQEGEHERREDMAAIGGIGGLMVLEVCLLYTSRCV